jgi:hypothetical protein
LRKQNLDLIIRSNVLSENALQTVTREFASDVNRSTNVTATIPAGVPPDGGKGEPVTIGAILLAIAGAKGVLPALVDIFRSFAAREPSLEFTIKSEGRQVSWKGKNMSDVQIHLIGEIVRNLN